jgi:hypothetical protein
VGHVPNSDREEIAVDIVPSAEGKVGEIYLLTWNDIYMVFRATLQSRSTSKEVILSIQSLTSISNPRRNGEESESARGREMVMACKISDQE